MLRGIAAYLFALIILAGCSLQLAPLYQQSLVDGLNQANTKASTLFATLGGGSPRSKFTELASQYDTVIGAFDSLRIMALSRPIPALSSRILENQSVKAACEAVASDASACVNPTPEFLGEIVNIWTDLKEAHQRNGIAVDLIEYYKPLYERQITFALTIENALKR